MNFDDLYKILSETINRKQSKKIVEIIRIFNELMLENDDEIFAWVEILLRDASIVSSIKRKNSVKDSYLQKASASYDSIKRRLELNNFLELLGSL